MGIFAEPAVRNGQKLLRSRRRQRRRGLIDGISNLLHPLADQRGRVRVSGLNAEGTKKEQNHMQNKQK
jgi:hypothetical protein